MTTWHPLLAAHEFAAGEWIMIDPLARPYAVVRMVEVGGERGYRAVTWAERSGDRQLIGYRRSLRGACEIAHSAFLRRHGHGDFIGYPDQRLSARGADHELVDGAGPGPA